MPQSSSRKTCHWIREGKSFSSTGKRTVSKGFRFQFPDAFENSNFRLDWYVLRVPIFTKAFPCPFNLDQKRLLEVKQLVWVQNRPLLKYEIQIKWPFSAHQFIIHESTYLSEWWFKRNNYTRGTWRGYAIDAILIQWHVNELRGILKLLQLMYQVYLHHTLIFKGLC